jgi:hypothetical protein
MKVSLRKRQLPCGKTMLVIEIADHRTRRRKATALLLVGDRAQDRDTWARAKAIRAKEDSDLLDVRFGNATNPRPISPPFSDFARQMIEHASAGMKSSMLSAIRRIEASWI